ncbi:MAG: biotin--[acetyl-CoA-carboxylase] ligase, partial [Planctomycetales bacterium]|nr:biotin--[acetyl-CoA-carboxylase] ligase [Planctomycetales bacterium]
ADLYTITTDALRQLRTTTFVKTIIHCDEAISTNDHALRIARDDSNLPDLPLIVYTDRQTAGRGRGQNRWWSAAGSLTFSLMIDASAYQLDRSHQPLISLGTGLAVATTLTRFDPSIKPQLKWPNDVHVGGRKIAGILSEVPQNRPHWIVIGVGLNVNNSIQKALCEKTLPLEIADIATALCDESLTPVPLISALATLLDHLHQQWCRLAYDAPGVLSDFRQRCMLTGRLVSLRIGDQVQTGRCLGINEQGAIVLQHDESSTAHFGGIVERVVD